MNGDWLLRGRDGRLTVYLPSDDAVLCRAELAPGGPWEPPRRIGGDQRLIPDAAVGQGADGYAHLVAWRPTGSGQAGLVHSTHFRPRLAPLDWQPVGHPDKKGERTGTPAVAVDARGRAHVFVATAAGGIGQLAQKEKGGWEPWRMLDTEEETGRAGVRGAPAAVTAASGRIEVYAAVRGGIRHWAQPEPGAPPVPGEFAEVPVRPGTLRALTTSADRTTCYFTDEHGELCAWRPGQEPVPLLASAGPGPVSAVRCVIDGHDCTLLAQRSASGRAVFAAHPTEQEAAGAWWTESGPALPADARVAPALDEQGEVVAAALSPSTGVLRLARRKDEPGLALGAWQEV
ncbi:hypothetical protein G3I20_10815 [Streptomyces sp. SID8111]|uniref:hypothetical protein n=1 Tax=Streptomyces sp. SID8111 TaxID=2706100 RepID=UPI0013BFB081|nr:hypothetical protein [Streptomyces sp. SID8111]